MHPARVASLPNRELLKLYFSAYGRITRHGFVSPGAADRETADCGFALTILHGRKRGRELLAQLHRDFVAGKIDAFGKEWKPPFRAVDVFGNSIKVEIVGEPHEFWVALVRRANLRDWEGILHSIHHCPRSYVLFIRERGYPIDVVWLKRGKKYAGEGKVIGIEEKVAPIDAAAHEVDILIEEDKYNESEEAGIRAAADAVLVLRAGTLKRLGIVPGTEIHLPL